MKKSLKRIVCGFLALVMVVPVIAMFPSLEVKAFTVSNNTNTVQFEVIDNLSFVHEKSLQNAVWFVDGKYTTVDKDDDEWNWQDSGSGKKIPAFERDETQRDNNDIHNGLSFFAAVLTNRFGNNVDMFKSWEINGTYSYGGDLGVVPIGGAGSVDSSLEYNAILDAVRREVGAEDASSSLIGIYAWAGSHVPSSSQTYRIVLACDYNIDTSEFIYYIAYATAQRGDEDSMCIAVCKSNTLMNIIAHYGAIDLAGANIDDDDIEDIIKYFCSDNELIDFMKNGKNSNYQNLNALDKFFNIEKINGIDYIQFKYDATLKVDPGGSEGLSFEISNDDASKGAFRSEECTMMDAETIIQGTIDNILTAAQNESNTKHNAMNTLVVSIINNIATNGGDGTLKSVDTILGNGGIGFNCATGKPLQWIEGYSGDCKFLLRVLFEYREILEGVIEASEIQDRFANANQDLLDNAKDYFEVAQILLQNNVEQNANREKTTGHNYVWKNMPGDMNDNEKIIEFGRSLDGKDWWDNHLTDYQRTILWSNYKAKITRAKLSYDTLSTPTNINMDFDQDAGKAIIDNLSSRYYTIDKAIEDLNGKRIEDIQATGSITVLCSYADLATEYVVFSSLYSNNTGGDIDSVYSLYNAQLDSMVTNIWNYDGVSDNYLPSMPKHIGIFDKDGEEDGNYHGMLETNENWNRFVALLSNVEYAFAVCEFSNIDGADPTSRYKAEDIKEWFEDKGGKDVVDAIITMRENTSAGNYELAQLAKSWGQLDSSAQYMLRSIIALEKMCQFLDIGLDDWSEQIKQYRLLYSDSKWKDFFDALDASGVMYSLAQEGTKTVDEPLGMFFSISEKQMTDQWVTGFALSSLYVPMETNVYDASSVTWLNNSDWVSDFYYKYGFYRKALYINTDNSAIVNNFVSGTQTGRRVATLSDLLNYDRDIILYVDDNFYNARDIDTVISRLDYTAIRNSNADPTDPDAEEPDNADVGLAQIGNAIAGMLDLDAGTILKTGTNTQYSTNLKSNCSQLGQEESTVTIKQKIFDEYLLSSGEILGDEQTESALDAYEYSVKTPYAVVSAVYRNDELYNETLRCAMYDTAIFKSSKAIASTPGTTSSNWRSLYNYYMLANLEEQMKNDSATVLDLDAPIFVDVFGNILTESGLVIIPAACNATLCGENWSPYTVGWSTYYNHGNQMTTDDFNSDVYEWLTGRPVSQGGIVDATEVQSAEKKNGGGYFVISGKKLVLLTSELTSGNITGTIQWDIINKNSTIVKQLFFNDAYFQKGEKMYSHALTNLIIETMRGAPIENIDYSYEGLSGTTDISKYGVYMAYKLEELVDMLGGKSTAGNSVVTMPNLAFVEGVEYIMMYVFKIVFSLMIVALGVSLYLDAVRGGLGVKSVVHFIATCLMVFVAFTLLPDVTNWTYYSANKNLLSDEAGRLMMLNYVKEYDGSEVGITKVTTPETETKLYMKLSDLDVPWWDIIPEVLFGNSGDTVSELYENSLKDNPMAMTPEVEMKSDGLYVDLQDVYDSSDIQFVPASNMLQHYTRIGYSNVSIPTTVLDGVDDSGNPIYHTDSVSFAVGTNCLDAVSFVSPYYAILDQLVANINEYNVSRDITAYSWSVGSNGHVLTYDVISPYLTSPEFIEEGYDILGLDRILKLPMQRTLYNYAFDDTDIAKMCRSSWYRDIDDYSGDYLRSRIDKLYLYARDYIVANRDVLGKVPDEVFLKVFAMQLAVEYNKIFGNIHGNAIEIIDVDTRDLMRFMVSDYADMYKYYSYSFSRYVYEEGGVLAVVFSSLLLVLYWATSFIKPLIMLVILGLLVLNVILRKTIFTQSNKAVEGYLIGMACLALCNYAYAFALKASLNIANLGLGTATALVFAFLVQVLYIIGLLGICVIEVKDWKNNGFYGFSAIGSNIMSQVMSAKNLVTDRLLSKGNEAYANSSEKRRFTSWSSDSVEDMLERDAEREERGTYSPN